MTALIRMVRLDQVDWKTFRRRRGWTVGVWVLLFIIITWYAALIPKFGSFQITSISKNCRALGEKPLTWSLTSPLGIQQLPLILTCFGFQTEPKWRPEKTRSKWS